jgi:capsular exopolysaccharide synthesis family protein
VIPSSGQLEPLADSSALLDALRVLRERWWIVLGGIVLCIAATLALALSQTKQYKATTTVLIKTTSLTTLIDPTQASTQDPARLQGDNLTLVRSLAVSGRVRTALGLKETLDDLRAHLDATANPNTDLINISYNDPSPARAASIANAYGDQLVAYLSATDQQQIAQTQSALQAQLAALPPTDPSRVVLEQALSRVIALKGVSTGNAVVVDRAEVPRSAASPRIKRDAIIGGLVGVVLGLALAFLFDLFDRRIKDIEDFERLYGRSPLTSIQQQKSRPTTERERHFELEPYRILRDGLDFISLRERVQVALVTSAVPAEGKTNVAAGLARAVATSGRRVALVEVDLHRPTLTRVLGLEPHPRGLTNVLSESGPPQTTALREVPDVPGLSVLTSGPLTPNSAELLRSPAMDRVLQELRRDFDFVVLDAPPLLHVSDAQVLMDNPLVDVVLVVARAYVTTREQARSARNVLDRHPEASVGLVINGVRDATGSYYYASGGGDNGAPTGGRGPRSRLGVRRRDKVRA